MLNGIVTSNEAGLAKISVGTAIFEAVTDVPAGQQVALYIRPEEVTLILENSALGRTSARNQLFGTISKMVQFGPFIRVTVDCGSPLTALITRRSCSEMQLEVGTPVAAGIKATAIHVISDSG
jgi:molybdopterin-binding protein